MEITTQAFFIFNFLIALWVIILPLWGKGKQGKPAKKALLVIIGAAYLGVVGAGHSQIQTSKSAYLGMLTTPSVDHII